MMQILAQRIEDANNFNGLYILQTPCQLSAVSICAGAFKQRCRIIKDLSASNQGQCHLPKNKQARRQDKLQNFFAAMRGFLAER
ncbi:MAG: hypothetical protein ACREOI_05715 [bacterium]